MKSTHHQTNPQRRKQETVLGDSPENINLSLLTPSPITETDSTQHLHKMNYYLQATKMRPTPGVGRKGTKESQRH